MSGIGGLLYYVKFQADALRKYAGAGVGVESLRNLRDFCVFDFRP